MTINHTQFVIPAEAGISFMPNQGLQEDPSRTRSGICRDDRGLGLVGCRNNKKRETGLYWLRATVIFIILAAALVFPRVVFADGQYRVLVDEGGVFFQTDSEGEWYIPEEDQQFFRPGQSGRYRFGRDLNGRYLETEHGKFHLGEGTHSEDIEAFNRAQREAQNPAAETEVTIVGQHVIVPVQIQYKGRSLKLNLLLDTGASIITLHENAVQRMHLPKDKTAHFTTAGGHVIPANMVELDEVRFGPFRQKDVLAGVIEYQQSAAVAFDGLLGMNALMGIDYTINYEKGSILWAKNS
jgi:predicted aspartyl protease